MRTLIRFLVAAFCCALVAALAIGWVTIARDRSRTPGAIGQPPAAPAEPSIAHVGLETFPDPNAPGTSSEVFIDQTFVDGDIFTTALPFTGTIKDPGSLAELREAVRGRGRRGLAALRAQFDQLQLGPSASPDTASQAIGLERSIAYLYMHEGKLADAASWLERALALCARSGGSPQTRSDLVALLGIVAMRRGEIENCLDCLGPSSCIFPISRDAVHLQQAGSREAIKHYMTCLQGSPGDLRLRWLLNLAYMTLGEWPDKVPQAYRIPPDAFASKLEVGAFQNVAPRVGLSVRGPNLAGGSIFDDFTGDGLIDLFTTSLDADLGASLYVNRGDGTFEDRSAAAGLTTQIYALNVARADFDNDGDPDLVLLRGAWEMPGRLSLLRNKGGGVFEDVTIPSGLGEPLSTESAVWGDYDNDGWVDLFVCGEFQGDPPDPRQRCRLYHNEHDGTFKDVAAKAGVTNERVAKGSAWGDYDGDGRLDLFVSNFDGPCRLYHNEGNGTFRDVADLMGVAGPPRRRSFACWFWDFDNDGRLDLFVNDYYATLAEVVAVYSGLSLRDPTHPHLYRNLGDQGFRDVSLEVGLVRPIAAMGANFGDIDNDGYLDAYFGTGWMSYSGLVPNVLLKNVGGTRFEDVTGSSRTGHLQKGHGVSFGDWDCDGDLDLFVELGGGYPGDQGYNALFQNPGHGGHWLKVRLEGTRTNRSALGAHIRVDVTNADGTSRAIHRVIGNNGSFGGNSLTETIGVGEMPATLRLTVDWPTSRTHQTFGGLSADQSIVVTEGKDSYQVLHQPILRIPPP
jgi:hypothetical protein